MKCLAAHIARAFLLTATIFCRLVGMHKGYKRSKFQSNRTTNKWVIKSQNIGYSSPTLDCLFESNATLTDWNETCARWKAWGHESLGQLDENSESLVFEFWALKLIFTNVWPLITYWRTVRFFWKISLIVSMVLKYLLAPFSIQSVKVTFSLFQSLCSSDDVYRPIFSPYISTCTACSALLFGTNMYLPITYKPYKKRTCLLRIDRVITVLPISRPNFHRVQCKIDGPFSSGRLAPIPLTRLYICRH